MKKHNLFVSLGMALLMGTSLFLTSCSEDPKAGPTVNIIAEAGYISADATVAPGDSVKIKINIVEGDGSISKVDFTRDGTSLSGYPKTEDVAAGNMVLATAAPSNVGTYTYDIIITDKNDQTQTGSIKITVAASAGAIDSWSAQTMGVAASTN